MIRPLDFQHRTLLYDLETLVSSRASLRQLGDALADDDALVLGYWQQCLLVGYAMIARLPFDAELQAIGVAPWAQRKGIGRQLLSAVIESAQTWESERVLLEVRESNRRAICLYRTCGFEEDSRRRDYYPAAQGAAGREDALLMSRLC